MNTVTTTKRDHRKETFTWEIEDLTLHFPFFEERPSPSIFGKLESPTFTTGEGTNVHSSWKLRIHSDYSQDRQNREAKFQICLEFLGYHSNAKAETRETVNCIHELYVSPGGGFTPPFFNVKRNGTFCAYRDSKLQLPHPGTCSTFDILPLYELYTRRVELFPEDSLRISVTIVTLLEAVHVNRMSPMTMTQKGTTVATLDNLDGCFHMLLKSERWSDVNIVCGDSTFFAHKLVLCARSPVFCKMLECPMKESATSQIIIEDMDVEILELMLTFMYKGKTELPQDKLELLQLLDCAEKYELHLLKSCCFHKILSTINEDNIAEFAMAAYSYGADKDTLTIIQNYCMERHSRLIKNPEYKKLFLNTPQAFVGDLKC